MFQSTKTRTRFGSSYQEDPYQIDASFEQQPQTVENQNYQNQTNIPPPFPSFLNYQASRIQSENPQLPSIKHSGARAAPIPTASIPISGYHQSNRTRYLQAIPPPQRQLIKNDSGTRNSYPISRPGYYSSTSAAPYVTFTASPLSRVRWLSQIQMRNDSMEKDFFDSKNISSTTNANFLRKIPSALLAVGSAGIGQDMASNCVTFYKVKVTEAATPFLNALHDGLDNDAYSRDSGLQLNVQNVVSLRNPGRVLDLNETVNPNSLLVSSSDGSLRYATLDIHEPKLKSTLHTIACLSTGESAAASISLSSTQAVVLGSDGGLLAVDISRSDSSSTAVPLWSAKASDPVGFRAAAPIGGSMGSASVFCGAGVSGIVSIWDSRLYNNENMPSPVSILKHPAVGPTFHQQQHQRGGSPLYSPILSKSLAPNSLLSVAAESWMIFAGTASGEVVFWDRRMGSYPYARIVAHQGPVWDVRVHLNHSFHNPGSDTSTLTSTNSLITCGEDGQVLHWDFGSALGKVANVEEAHVRRVQQQHREQVSRQQQYAQIYTSNPDDSFESKYLPSQQILDAEPWRAPITSEDVTQIAMGKTLSINSVDVHDSSPLIAYVSDSSTLTLAGI